MSASFLTHHRCGKLQRFSGGEYIIRQGQPSDEVYLILRGSCAVLRKVRLHRDGRPLSKLSLTLTPTLTPTLSLTR